MQKGNLFIVSGPSGSGKTTLSKNVLQNISNIRISVSYTTRKPRAGEIDRTDYRFISDREFDDLIENHRLIEWAVVHGYRYGTPINYIQEAESTGTDLLMDIDVQGARSIKKYYKYGVYIFVIPSTLDILRKRLINRKTEGRGELDKRIKNAIKEMQDMSNYDYIIINDSLKEAVQNLTAIIIADRCRRERILENSKLNY